MSETSARSKEFRVDGIKINIHSSQQAAAAVLSAAQTPQSSCFFTLNLDHCARLRTDANFRRAYRRAQFVSADGFPVALLGRMSGIRVRRATGADLVAPICVEAARRRLPVFLLGPTTDVLRRAEARLCKQAPGVEIAGAYAPGANFDPVSIDADVAAERIRQSGARICFLAIGSPRQEIFAARCLDLMPGVCLICVGAALDFIAGSQSRAPRFIRDHGLEWLWRLSHDPRRLLLRYLKSAAIVPRLLADAIPQAISARAGRAS